MDNEQELNHKNILNKYGLDEIESIVVNPKNRIFTKSFLCDFMKKYTDIEYEINDIKIFEIAMTHKSYTKKKWTDIKEFKSIFPQDNIPSCDNIIHTVSKNDVVSLKENDMERLELYGDALLGSIQTDYLLCRYDGFGPGELTESRALIENRKAFSEITKKISLNKYILISKYYENVHARDKDNKLLCDLFESFICALFYDICKIKYEYFGNNENIMNLNRGFAYQICWFLVVKLIEEELNIPALLENDTNYKKKLLIEYHKLKWSAPLYRLIETRTDEKQINKKYYKTGVYDNNKNIIGIGISTAKNNSEKMAAKNALQYLNLLEKNNEEIEELPDNSNIINFK